MFRKRATSQANERKARDRRRRPAIEDLESRTVLSTLHFHAPAIEAMATSQAEVGQARIGAERLQFGRVGRVTFGGTVSLPVTVSGNLTVQSFAVTNNQLTATGSLNVNGVMTPVTFNASVTQQGTNAPVMTLTPQATSVNISGLGTVALDTQTAITVGSSTALSTLLGQVVTSAGGVSNLSGIASGLNSGLTSSNDVLANFSVNGAVSSTLSVQRFTAQNGLLAAQATVNGTQLTLPVNTALTAGASLSLSTGTAGSTAVSLGTGVSLQTGDTITVPINGIPGPGNLIANLVRQSARNPRQLFRIVGQLNQRLLLGQRFFF